MLHLSVKTRNKNKKAKHLLQEEVIPAVVYGPKNPPKSLSVGYKSFYNTYKEAGETTLIALDIDKGDSKENKEGEEVTQEVLSQANNVVLIREVQVHPVSGKFMHIDFYQLPLDKEIELSIPVESSGEAPAVKELGGILVQNLHEVNIKALPTNLIHEITVDLSGLKEMGNSILVKDLIIPSNIEILADMEQTVFTVEQPREEEEEPVVETTEGEAIESIKTEGEEEREAREKEEQEKVQEQKV